MNLLGLIHDCEDRKKRKKEEPIEFNDVLKINYNREEI